MNLKEALSIIKNTLEPVLLDMSDSNLGDEEIQVLTDALRKASVSITLDLSYNSIGDHGIKHLASLIGNSLLTITSLAGNEIGDEGAKYLAEVVSEVSTAITLNLDSNHIGNIDAKYFAFAIKKASVPITLNLNYNDIEDGGIFASAILEISIPLTLYLEGTKAGRMLAYSHVMDDSFVIEAGINPSLFIDKIKSNIKFINKELPIIPLNVAHPVFSLDLVGKLITDFLGLLEISTINIKAIREVEASIDNKYSSINYNVLNSINHRLSSQSFNNEDKKKMSGEGFLKLQPEYHKLSPIDPFYNRYYKDGLDEMLFLRLKDTNLQDIATLSAFKLNIYTLQTTLSQITKKIDEGFDKIIIPSNIEGKHWVGFLFQKTADSLKVLYLDSEHNKLAVNLKNQVIEYFQKEYQDVLIIEEVVERQKYNNCGPEVIENFIKYLGKERLPQDETVYYHSQLLEQSLLSLSLKRFLDYDDYIMTTVPSVSYDILMLCQTSASHKQSTPVNLLPLIKEVSLEEMHPNTELSLQITNQASSDNTGSIPNIGTNFIKHLNNYVEHYLKKIFLPDEFYEMQQLANKYKVDIKIVDEVTLKQAYKKIALKTHPDKYPDDTEDFIKAKQLLEQKEGPLPTELYTPIMQKLQKVNIIVEAVDTAIDSVRAFKDPSLENVLKVGAGCVHLASMYTGKTGVILPIAVVGSAYQAYQGDCWKAATSMTKAIGFTLMFSTVYTTAPAVAVVLSTGFTGYATYSMLNNGYELYNEFLEPNPINDSNQDTFDFSFQS